MTVTSIVPEGRTKYAVAIDGECVFTLYKGELSRYRIREGGELSEEAFVEIMQTLLPKRGEASLHESFKEPELYQKAADG